MNECCNINEAIKEFYNSLLAFTLKKVSDRQVAEDIIQEVMYRLTSAYRNNSKIGNLRAWLYQTTRHAIAEYYRERNKTFEFLLKSGIDAALPEEESNSIVSNQVKRFYDRIL